MSEMQKIATVFGGTGFLGRQIVRELAKRGYTIKVASRAPERAYFLRTAGFVGQIVPFACDYSNPESLGVAVRGADIVVNCIGILYERRKGDFKKVHADFPAALAAACAYEKVQDFIHISALGVEQGRSQYLKTKAAGEKNVLENFPAATILRPSVMFGEDDNFFNRFARLAQILPALILINKGQTKFQPVYVGDVADAVMACVDNPAAKGQVFELGGPEIVTFREIYERLFRYTQRRRCLVNVSFGLAKAKASILGLMPNPILTRDQVETLKSDSIVSGNRPGFQELGITPTAMDLILPEYLETYRPGGRFSRQKAA